MLYEVITFNIYWDQDKYYVVSQGLEPIAIGNLNRCYLEGQCSNATSLEEARQLVNEQVVQTP